MSISCIRLCNSSFLSSLCRVPTVLNSARYAQMAAGAPKVIFKKFEPPKQEDYDHKNTKLGRPLSPHLTIYSVQLTSMLSITHRITGMALSGYAMALGMGAMMLPNDISHYISIIENLNLSSPTLFMLKALIAAPFSYHFCNGVRHLYWDTARGLGIKEVYKTGYLALGSALLLTIILSAL